MTTTAAPILASGASDLLDMRRAGIRPDGSVNVSLIGRVPDPGLTLFVGERAPDQRLDWRMLLALPVVVWAQSSISFQRISALLLRIAHAKPQQLQLYFFHANEWHTMDCGFGVNYPTAHFDHLPDIAPLPSLHVFTWWPVNVGNTTVGKRLTAALSNAKPIGYKL